MQADSMLPQFGGFEIKLEYPEPEDR